MNTDILNSAEQLVEAGPGGMKDLRVHMFEDPTEYHDDDFVSRIHDAFFTDFLTASQLLDAEYGPATRNGAGNDKEIPLDGVLKFGIWAVGDLSLYLAVAHEDRETPVLLMLGTVG